ncbi:ergothioneine biosynthesis protein EgtB [Crenobacter sp. SG2303]|uniref:Ergothioneine biosynthesis protein EgtB n=1 Tax=Crenobacter oryzisoli TaxID=3056844 RepID=A0ABT7XT83_9NEIS|nr:ergothioneine biosynthesis protein EgtB [Crenobacter sp. SG2303]MDN0077010.1 ergothioneine biosynthesis protein EgtB [Crenobacter sp. SG2303]
MEPRQAALQAAFTRTRRQSLALAEGLSAEDCMLQSMPDASPVKWHLAHVTWFFETFVLAQREPPPAPFNPAFKVLFNSYYVGVGERHPRPERGLLSRPSLDEVLAYRRAVDAQMAALLADTPLPHSLLDLIELGIHHEQQHQELVLTDLKHHFWRNPLRPAYRPPEPLEPADPVPLRYQAFEGGLVEIGHDGEGFAFDNETPRHRVFLEPFELACRPVSNRDYLAFIADGGYDRPELWLSDGWDTCQREGWFAPLYWQFTDADRWTVFTLHGQQPLRLNEPVCHVSYYEAEAYARWAGARLPTEQEWECAAQRWPAEAAPAPGRFADAGAYHPGPTTTGKPVHWLGDVWEWTQSAYLPYPGYRPADGAVGEYNGKFMINQMVLRGGSCATPSDHIRASYRNFFPPSARWQFSGIRLAR